MRRIALIAAASAIAAVAATSAGAASLVTNGNFEGGNSAFSSGYTYVSPGAGALYPEGVYTVDNNPNNSHNSFTSFGDHTSGEGQFMIVNGAGTPGTTVWSQNVSVTAGKTYNFSAFVSSLYPSSPAALDFFAGSGEGLGALVFSTTAPAGAGTWQGVSGSFTATGSFVTLTIVNQNTQFGGNDFGLDDIALTAASVPEASTWSMLLAGFGMVGFAARRRRVAVAA